jgi:hypothetical protein
MLDPLAEGSSQKGRPGRGATKVFGRGVVASALAGTPLRRAAERIGEVVSW